MRRQDIEQGLEESLAGPPDVSELLSEPPDAKELPDEFHGELVQWSEEWLKELKTTESAILREYAPGKKWADLKLTHKHDVLNWKGEPIKGPDYVREKDFPVCLSFSKKSVKRGAWSTGAPADTDKS